ncbi:hypothetical protein AAFF_G00337460 [Aldrovandia affinis]|uniref:CCHC-type domain-containing protein n=1 Tax=Aldrovandia affinis TaxID=143900 RepID=A0AAD7SKV3_9TELE|nr:hypothetical protein AAFF_G00337460 [Aldrovandia affinis]
MATYGKIGEFEPETDDWQQYMERLDFYFAANKIDNAGQKRAIFLSACGGKVYAVLRDLYQPNKPDAGETTWLPTADCRFVDAVCHNCHKRGHLARKCRSARQPRRDTARGGQDAEVGAILAAYEYTLEYKEGSKHGNADALSRLPLPTMPVDTPHEGEVVMLMEHMNGTPLQVKQIREWTRRDRVLSRVHQWLLQGSWPRECTDPEVQPYMRRQNELSVEEGCTLWGSRVIIPPPGRQTMIAELHEAHPGSQE